MAWSHFGRQLLEFFFHDGRIPLVTDQFFTAHHQKANIMAFVSNTCSPIHHMISFSFSRVPMGMHLIWILANWNRTATVDETEASMDWLPGIEELLLHDAVNSICSHHDVGFLDLAIGECQGGLLVILSDTLQLVTHENHLRGKGIHHHFLQVTSHDDVSTWASTSQIQMGDFRAIAPVLGLGWMIGQRIKGLLQTQFFQNLAGLLDAEGTTASLPFLPSLVKFHLYFTSTILGEGFGQHQTTNPRPNDRNTCRHPSRHQMEGSAEQTGFLHGCVRKI
mmetsp:Transcript_11394/g.19250  ORF Transcript_11394/g.19250 Transcript_11394/m.19250 type:complete len:278 (+) Transcript_11394:615-1448(+)